MDTRTFELLTKFYNEFTKRFDQIDKRFDEVDTRFDEVDRRFEGVDGKFVGIEKRLENLEKGQRKLELVIENDIKPDIKALFEGYVHTYEKLEEHDRRFDAIENKLENQNIEIMVLKGTR